MIRRRFFLLLSVFLLMLFPAVTQAEMEQPFDHSSWDQFLKKFVNEKGEVDYRGVKKDAALLDAYLEQLRNAPERSHGRMASWPREESLAFWMNAYNAGVIALVRDYYPVDSINDIAGIWEQKVIKIRESAERQSTFSLNDIRAKLLIDRFRDEKIHAALTCGARGCPRLHQEAFTGPKVEGQLFLAAREFVNSEYYNKIVPGSKKIWLSSILKWYGSDFKVDFGAVENDRGLSPEEYAVLSFMHHYLEDGEKASFLEDGQYRIKYLTFDWSLNEWVRSETSSSVPPASK